jgi:hypothetical protein
VVFLLIEFPLRQQKLCVFYFPLCLIFVDTCCTHFIFGNQFQFSERKTKHAYVTMEAYHPMCRYNHGQEEQEERWFWFDWRMEAKALDSQAIVGEQAQGGSWGSVRSWVSFKIPRCWSFRVFKPRGWWWWSRALQIHSSPSCLLQFFFFTMGYSSRVRVTRLTIGSYLGLKIQPD